MTRLLPLLLLLFAAPAFGQVVEVPYEVDPASLVELKSEVAGRWMPNEFPASFTIKVWPDRKSAAISSGTAGTQRTILLIPDDAKKPIEAHLVKAKGVEPKPGPPNPQPEPRPAPLAGKAWVVVVEETDDRAQVSAEVIEALHSGSLQAAIEAEGDAFRTYDDDETTAPVPSLLAALKSRNIGLPAMIVMDEKGKVGAAKPLPPTTNEIIATIKEATGR